MPLPLSAGVRLGDRKRAGTLAAVIVTALALASGTPAAAWQAWDFFDNHLDQDGNGREDALDAWLAGSVDWDQLRYLAVPDDLRDKAAGAEEVPPDLVPNDGPWLRGNLRLVCLGETVAGLAAAVATGAAAGTCEPIAEVARFGAVTTLEIDAPGLAAFLAAAPAARYLLDRDGRPALAVGRAMVGADRIANGFWQLAGDWTGTIAILDSGCDTAHDDLGDFSHDNIDGPPPEVGHALDWFPADSGWPAFQGFKVVGWHDVTDDFPLAQGPWDYHYHGTALAGVAAGAGAIDPDLRGVASGARLTIVKFYDFDGIWHQWASDFLTAADWVLEHHETYRIQIVLAAVNWEVDVGLSDAMTALLDVGILPIVAMGNDGPGGDGPGLPAAAADAVTVGAVDDAGAVAAYSGRGNLANGKPDLVAPGGGLLPATGRITTTDNEPNDTYSDRYGTSLAAAHVAGVANLLLEALRKQGYARPQTRREMLAIAGLLAATAAPVHLAESADGSTVEPLDPATSWDWLRGRGIVQAEPAVDALLRTLEVATAVTDSLSGLPQRSVIARRLSIPPGVDCEMVAEPGGGLDIQLLVVDTDLLTDPQSGYALQPVNRAGAGQVETVAFTGSTGGASCVVVRRLAGEGEVVLRVRAIAGEPAPEFLTELEGSLTGWVNAGQLADTDGTSLVLTSLVRVDAAARAVYAFDLQGELRAGWPVFFFHSPSFIGPLTAPLVWDLNGQPGDEIVIASAFGSLFFRQATGQFLEVALAPNRTLTAPVAVVAADGQRRVVVVDESGFWQSFNGDGIGGVAIELPAAGPLPPAVGQLTAAPGEEMVVAFASGDLYALDADGNVLPGWPVTLGSAQVVAPLLWDRDGDRLHEVVVPLIDSASGEIRLRIFAGDAAPAADDGTVVPSGGGGWLRIGSPAVLGSYHTETRLVMPGLTTNGLVGDQLRWQVALGGVTADGVGWYEVQPGFQLRGATPTGTMELLSSQLPTVVGWNYTGDSGTDPEYAVALRWRESISGAPNLVGAAIDWLRPGGDTFLAGRCPVTPGGPGADEITVLDLAVAPLTDGDYRRVTVLDDRLLLQTAAGARNSAPLWSWARADGRNSGAYPLPPEPTAVATVSGIPWLGLWPNPSAGTLYIRWRNLPAAAATLDVYDLRGRRVRRLAVAPESGEGLAWDGRDAAGRIVAAGTYLFVLTHRGGRVTGRAVITR